MKTNYKYPLELTLVRLTCSQLGDAVRYGSITTLLAQRVVCCVYWMNER